MTALIISGSRNPEGKTAQAAKALFQGFLEAGGVAEMLFLPHVRIERCRQCEDHGWGLCLSDHRCVIEDDFAGLIEKIRAADVSVFATPVYFSDLSESLRAFIDRMNRISFREPGQQAMHGLPAVGICVAGGGGTAVSCSHHLERALSASGFNVLDVIPVSNETLDLKQEVLRTTGRWLARRIGGAS